MWTYLGKVIRVGRGWTDADGVQHPTNWATWSDEEKAERGLVWQDEPASYDNRFYWDANTPKALEDVDATDEDGNAVLDENGEQVITRGLKWNAIQTVKAQAAGLLSPTDWMVIKASEVADYSVPADVLTYRAAVRSASNDIEAAITNAADHDAFMALYTVPVDEDGVPTGNAPINDWPEAL